MTDATMTPADVREIVMASGLAHAEYCVEQATTQIGRDAAAPLWNELRLLHAAANGEPQLPPDDFWFTRIHALDCAPR